MSQYFTYILVSEQNGTLYVGVTNDLIRRVYEHKQWLADWFTKKYNIKTLVYFDVFPDIRDAIEREKRIKKWDRDWKIRLIEETNPDWKDLYPEII